MTISVPEERRRQALELLSGDRASLLVTQPFAGLMALRMELGVVAWEELGVGGTDGTRLLFGAEFVLGADALDRRYVMAHLVWHAALMHPWTRPAECDAAMDCALDHEVNRELEPFFDLPPGSPWFEPLRGWGTERVAAWLRQHPACTTERGPLADHHLRAGAGSRGDGLGRPVSSAAARCGRQLWVEHLIGASQQLRRRGLSPPDRVAGLLARHRASEVPWSEVLAEFLSGALGDRRRWIPPSRRWLHRSVYLPSRHAETLRVVTAVDTSASTLGHQPEFWSQVLSILGAHADHELTILECDDRVRTVRTYDQRHPPDAAAFEVSGLGGTDFRPVFDLIAGWPEPPRALVYLTDGRGPAPSEPPPYPVLWLVSADGQRASSWGRTVFMPAVPEPLEP